MRADWAVVEDELQVVAVRPDGGELRGEVALERGFEGVAEGCLVCEGLGVVDASVVLFLGNVGVNF